MKVRIEGEIKQPRVSYADQLNIFTGNPERITIIQGTVEIYSCGFDYGFEEDCIARILGLKQWENVLGKTSFVYASHPGNSCSGLMAFCEGNHAFGAKLYFRKKSRPDLIKAFFEDENVSYEIQLKGRRNRLYGD